MPVHYKTMFCGFQGNYNSYSLLNLFASHARRTSCNFENYNKIREKTILILFFYFEFIHT